jgi:hypothetical protein
MFLSAVPAYGRDYKSKKEVLADWNAGKDFLIQDMRHSGYVNKNDAPKGATINIRYKRLTQVLPIKVK